MSYMIRIDVLEPDREAFDFYEALTPICMKLSPLQPAEGKATRPEGRSFYFLAMIEVPEGGQAELNIRTGAEWLTQFVANIKPARVCINGEGPKSKADLYNLIEGAMKD